jgi:hypothetical protein
MNVSLAELLGRRKELAEKVNRLSKVQQHELFQVRTQRAKVTDGFEDLIAQVPVVKMADVTAEYDFYASQLRKCDALIQKQNWACELDDNGTMKNFQEANPDYVKPCDKK